MKKILANVFIITPFFFSSIQPACSDTLKDSVVKVFVTTNSVDYYKPWQSRGSKATYGSGCIIKGNKILTNAHVVADHTFIQLRKGTDPKKYTAKLKAIGHDCDLAILTVDDPEFFEGVEPLDFGDLPNLQDKVTALGFPQGGDKLSITEGVVSRIELTSYSQSSKKLLTVQIDAAINPGNSGGPILQNGKIVGIAMQVMHNSQNIGYMIPTPIINHFLEDLQDNKYDGFPSIGINFSNTENRALRKYYDFKNESGGILVTEVLPYSPVDGILQPGDIVIELDGVAVGVDGTFKFRNDERLSISHLVNNKQVGDNVPVKVIRKGKVQILNIRVTKFVPLVPKPNHFEKPPYYIYGGLVFTVLTSDLIRHWGNRWWEKAPFDFLYHYIGPGKSNEKRKKEIVVLLNVLPDDINIGYHDFQNEVITQVNSKSFDSFEEFVNLLEDGKSEYAVFETENKLQMVLDNSRIDQVTQEIIDRNNIPSRFSEDISQWLKRKGTE